ncbi:unnamed protein product [Gadus morhua 'NCC']
MGSVAASGDKVITWLLVEEVPFLGQRTRGWWSSRTWSWKESPQDLVLERPPQNLLVLERDLSETPLERPPRTWS